MRIYILKFESKYFAGFSPYGDILQTVKRNKAKIFIDPDMAKMQKLADKIKAEMIDLVPYGDNTFCTVGDEKSKDNNNFAQKGISLTEREQEIKSEDNYGKTGINTDITDLDAIIAEAKNNLPDPGHIVAARYDAVYDHEYKVLENSIDVSLFITKILMGKFSEEDVDTYIGLLKKYHLSDFHFFSDNGIYSINDKSPARLSIRSFTGPESKTGACIRSFTEAESCSFPGGFSEDRYYVCAEQYDQTISAQNRFAYDDYYEILVLYPLTDELYDKWKSAYDKYDNERWG